MDLYTWFTINNEAHDRFRDRIDKADGRRLLQRTKVAHPFQRRRLRLSLGTFLIAAGTRLQVEEAAVHERG